MTELYEVGQTVLIIDQRPPAEEIIKVSTWTQVTGLTGGDSACYLIRAATWARDAWIGGVFIRPVSDSA